MEPKKNIFGSSAIEKIGPGDIVRWHTLKRQEKKDYIENIGIITNVYVDFRGGRQVAMAKIIPLNGENSGNVEIEMFLACIKLISKAVSQ